MVCLGSHFICPTAEAAVLTIPDGITETFPPVLDGGSFQFIGPTVGGTLEVLANQIFSPNTIFNNGPGLGILVLDNNSQCNSFVTIGDPFNPLNQITLNGNAAVDSSSDLSTLTFNLGQNTLTVNGPAIDLLTGDDFVINTTVLSDTVFGHIMGGEGLFLGASPIIVNVDATGANLSGGESLTIVDSIALGSVNNPVNVTSNNPMYSFTGVNFPQGDIVITAFLNFLPPALPFVPGVGTIEDELLTIGLNNPGSDIATVMTAITSLPSSEDKSSALLQLNPIADGSTPWISFSAAQQFQTDAAIGAVHCDCAPTRGERSWKRDTARSVRCADGTGR